MRQRSKIAIGVVIFFAAILVANLFVRMDSRDNGSQSPLDNAAALRDITIFEVQKDLTEEEADRYFEEFQKAKKNLEAGQRLVSEQGEAAGAVLYWPVLTMGSIHRDVGDYRRAEESFLLANAMQPTAFPPLGNLGELYFRYLKDYQKAEEYYLKATDVQSDYLDTYYYELTQLYRFFLKDEAKAENVLREGVKKYPDDTSILALLALYYRETGNTEEAISRYHELLVKDPASTVAVKALEELQQ